MRRHRLVRRLLWSITGALLALGAAAGWVVYTPSGLAWAWQQIQQAGGGALQADRVSGTLAGPLQVSGFLYRNGADELRVGRAELRWEPLALLSGRLWVSSLDVEGVDLSLGEGGDGTALRGWFVPLGVHVQQALLQRGVVHFGSAQPLVVDGAELNGDVFARHVDPLRLTAHGPWGRLSAVGRVGLAPDAALALTVRATTPLVGDGLNVSGELAGSVAMPRVDVALSGALQGHLQGDAHLLSAEPSWHGVLQLSGLAPALLPPQAAPETLRGRVEATGSGVHMQLDADLNGSGHQIPFRTRFSVQRSAERWSLPRFVLTPGDGNDAALQAHGQWQQGDGGITDVRQLSLQLQWHDLSWPLSTEQPWRSPHGQVSLSGALSAFRVHGSVQLAAPALPPADLLVDGNGKRNGVDLTVQAAHWLAGRWHGRGRLRWSPVPTWDASLQVQGVDPGQVWAQWPGQLGGVFTARGTRQKGRWQAQGQLSSLTGTLRGYAVNAEAQMALRDAVLTVKRLQLNSGDARLKLVGTVGGKWDLSGDLNAPDLAALWPDTRGTVSLHGQLRGARGAPRLSLTGQGSGVGYADYGARQVRAEAQLGPGDGPWRIDLRAQHLSGGRLPVVRDAALSVSGQRADHDIDLDLDAGQQGHLQWQAQGRWDGTTWRGRLHDGRLMLPGGAPWRQQEPATATLGGGVTLTPVCWVSVKERWCAGGQWQPGDTLGAQLQLDAFSLTRLDPWLPRHDLGVSGGVSGKVSIQRDPEGWGSQGSLRSDDGSFTVRLPDGSDTEQAYRHILMTLGDGAPGEPGVHGSLVVEMASGDRLEARVRVPDWRLGQPLSDQQGLVGELSVAMSDFQWLPLVAPQISLPDGRLEGSLSLAGTIGTPRLDGNLELTGGKLVVTNLGVELRRIKLDLHSGADADVLLRFNGEARSGPGQAWLHGTLRRPQEGPLRLEMALRGERFEVVRLPRSHVLINPQLALHVSPGQVQVDGSLGVPEAHIDLPKLPASAAPSPDVVVVDEPQPDAPRPWQVNARVQVLLGDKVEVNGFGFSGKLGGRLTVVQEPGLPPRGQGELRISDGRYQAYGQDLTISSGRLLFADSPLDNPGVEVRAERQVEQVQAGVAVSGRVQQPRLQLFSDPTMDDSDILAYLVLGHPMSSVTSSEAGNLRDAADSLGLIGGARLAKLIGARFGISDVRVESGADLHQSTALVLGTYLSPRLYLQYAVGLWETANRVQVRYTIGRHWTLEAQSSEQSGADLLYTIDR